MMADQEFPTFRGIYKIIPMQADINNKNKDTPPLLQGFRVLALAASVPALDGRGV